MRLLMTAAAMLACITTAQAFDFNAETFGEQINTRASSIGSKLRVFLLTCKHTEVHPGQLCVYQAALGLKVSEFDPDDLSNGHWTGIIWSGETTSADQFVTLSGVVMSLCSPNVANTERDQALQTLLDDIFNPQKSVERTALLPKVAYFIKRIDGNVFLKASELPAQ